MEEYSCEDCTREFTIIIEDLSAIKYCPACGSGNITGGTDIEDEEDY